MLSNLILEASNQPSFQHPDTILRSVSQTHAPGRFTFNVNVQSIFDLYINTADKVKEDYTVLNAKAAYRFGTRDKGLNLFVKGENLTATRYSINEGFPMPKAIFMGGIDVTF